MTGRDEVDRLVEVITVDCYNPSEQMTAFYEVFAEEVPLPTTATVVGATVRVVGIDIADHDEELAARSRPVAALNREAGSHLITTDPRELAAALRAGSVAGADSPITSAGTVNGDGASRAATAPGSSP